MADSFSEASRVEAVSDDEFRIDVPDGWQQGRGAFGGLGVAYCIRAIEHLEPERTLRALTAEIPGPLGVGEAKIETRMLRRGKGMSTVEATVSQQGEVKLRATGLLGRARAAEVAFEPEPPTGGDWREVPAVPPGVLPPRFIQHFEVRVTGPTPFSNAAEATAEGWVRPAVELPSWGPAEVAALSDVMWPSYFAKLTGPRPMATVTYTLQLAKAAQDLDPTQPLLYRARSHAASEGFVSELRELWTPDGRLVALNPQTFIVIA